MRLAAPKGFPDAAAARALVKADAQNTGLTLDWTKDDGRHTVTLERPPDVNARITLTYDRTLARRDPGDHGPLMGILSGTPQTARAQRNQAAAARATTTVGANPAMTGAM